jgi:type IV secretory pathway VirB10-like protein
MLTGIRSLVRFGSEKPADDQAAQRDPHASTKPQDLEGLYERRAPLPRIRRSGFFLIGGGAVLVFGVSIYMAFSGSSAAAPAAAEETVAPIESTTMEVDPSYVVRAKERGMALPPAPPDAGAAMAGAPPSDAPDALPAGIPRLTTEAAPESSTNGRASAASGDADAQRRKQEEDQARTASFFVEVINTAKSGQGGAAGQGGLGAPPPGLQATLGALAGLQGAAAAAGGPGGPPQLGQPGQSGQDSDPNGQLRKAEFLRGARREGKAAETDLPPDIHLPRSPFELRKGTLIPVQLLTAINSDLPGKVVGKVIAPVYDTVRGESVLIPQLAELHGSYDSRVEFGQERLLFCWQQLYLPNNVWVDLDCSPGVDAIGQSGVAGGVDNHWSQIIAGAVLSALMSAGAQAAAGDVTGFRPTFAQSFAGGAAADINSTGQQLTRRQMNRQPTISIPPGVTVQAMLSKTLVIPPYYASQR